MMLFVYRRSRRTRSVTSRTGLWKNNNSKKSSRNALTFRKRQEKPNRQISSNVLMSRWLPLNSSENWKENAKSNLRKRLMRLESESLRHNSNKLKLLDSKREVSSRPNSSTKSSERCNLKKKERSKYLMISRELNRRGAGLRNSN